MSVEVRDQRQPGWLWMDNEIVYEYAAQMKPMALACYVYLCARANHAQQCWPSQRTMAEELGVDRGTVRSAVKRLKELGLIHLEVRRNEDGSHNSTIYTLLKVQKSDEGGGSIAQGGSSAQGGSIAPNNTHKNKTQRNNSPEGEANASADEFVALLDEELRDSVPKLTKARKARYGKEFREFLESGYDSLVLYEALDRIVERWDGYQLTVEQAIHDNAKPKNVVAIKKNSLPEQHQWQEGFHDHTKDYTSTSQEERRRIARELIENA